MKIVKLKGGLGNQLFQYAFAYYLRKELKEEVLLDSSIYKKFNSRSLEIDKFKIDIEVKSINKKLKKLKFGSLRYKFYILYKILSNKKYCFERSIEIKNHYMYDYFDGYWQDLKYLIKIEDELKSKIELINKLDLSTTEEESVAIGFRKGDYLNKENLKKYGECDDFYYKNAILLIKSKIKNPIFYIFSDDIALVKKDIVKIFSKSDTIKFINENKRFSPAEELMLMTKCKHAIIPNSTFSWWGAWLIKNPQKMIIAPKYWYKDNTEEKIIPKEWLRVGNKGE